MNRPIRALAFDAYGTLFDVHSVIALCDKFFPGHGAALSQLWRAKQLEYTWLRALMGRYRDFAVVTEDALVFAAEALTLPLQPIHVQELMAAYLKLAPFPEIKTTLNHLHNTNRQLAILSNGSPAMLDALVRYTGLAQYLDAVLSVDAVQTYKPHSAVYQLAVDKCGGPKDEIGFVTANCWDAMGAKAFGFVVFWINRQGAKLDQLGFVPDAIISKLDELPPLLGGPLSGQPGSSLG